MQVQLWGTKSNQNKELKKIPFSRDIRTYHPKNRKLIKLLCRFGWHACGGEIDGAYKNLSVAVHNSFRTSVGNFLANYGGGSPNIVFINRNIWTTRKSRAVSGVDSGIKSSKSSTLKYYYIFYKRGQFYYRFDIFYNIISRKNRIIRAL